MLKMLIHVSQEFETLSECEEFYEEIKGELRHHPALHVNGQVTTKFLPSHYDNTPEKGPPK